MHLIFGHRRVKAHHPIWVVVGIRRGTPVERRAAAMRNLTSHGPVRDGRQFRGFSVPSRRRPPSRAVRAAQWSGARDGSIGAGGKRQDRTALSCNRQRGRILWVRMFAAHGMGAPGDVRSADQKGRSMMGTVVFRGVPNQPESASRSASAAVSVGSSMVAAQAMWASGRIRRASAGR
jgi:hypothetical protein